MARRVCIGKRATGSYGLFVTRPGFDVLTENPADRAKFAFSSTWSDVANVLQSGTCAGETWVSLPVGLDFWPPIMFDLVITSTKYNFVGATSVIIAGRPGGYQFSDTTVRYRTSAGRRQFQIGANFYGSFAAYTFRYVAMNLVPD